MESAASPSAEESGRTPSTAGTFAEMRQFVKEQYSWVYEHLYRRYPTGFQVRRLSQNFSEDGSGASQPRCRVYFLGIPKGCDENTLVCIDYPPEAETLNADVASEDDAPVIHEGGGDVDMPDKSHIRSKDFQSGQPVLRWRPLLQSSSLQGQTSKRVELLQERKREALYGLTGFQMNPWADSGVCICSKGSVAYLVQVDQRGTSEVSAHNNSGDLTQAAGDKASVRFSQLGSEEKLDEKFCPHEKRLLAFVKDSDIWLRVLGFGEDESGGQELRLTHFHDDQRDDSSRVCSAGVASFITQEEFNRFSGYWWEPESCQRPSLTRRSHSNYQESTYRILFEVVDETHVPEVKIISPDGFEEPETFRYPRAGERNSTSHIHLLQFSLLSDGPENDSTNVGDNPISGLAWVPEDGLQVLSLNTERQDVAQALQGAEYMPRIHWSPCGQYAVCHLLNRHQNRLSIVAFPVSSFGRTSSTDPNTDTVHTLYTEESAKHWVSICNVFHMFPESEPGLFRFLIASEMSGFRHLYLVEHGPCNQQHTDNLDTDCSAVETCIGDTRTLALTSGEWEVSRENNVWVDEGRGGCVYFAGAWETVLEHHLYAVSLIKPCVVSRLTELGYHHKAFSMDGDCTLFVVTRSNVGNAPEVLLYALDRETTDPNGLPTATVLAVIMERVNFVPESRLPQLLTYDMSPGVSVNCLLYKPFPAFRTDVPGENPKYPVIFSVYGGPEIQQIYNEYHIFHNHRWQVQSAAGYAVLAMDCRGCAGRGLEWEAYTQSCMGSVEVEDHVKCLQWVAEKTGCLDLTRVAITGWSYGGYLSLMALAQRPDVFRIAIAGAPVTSWRLYDTAFTERYMGHPDESSAEYDSSSVMHYVHKFPEEKNRLLLIHGLVDDNVHFAHTLALISALVRARKPYQLQLFPRERHGLRRHDSQEHNFATVFSFLHDHLKCYDCPKTPHSDDKLQV